MQHSGQLVSPLGLSRALALFDTPAASSLRRGLHQDLYGHMHRQLFEQL